MTNIQSKLRLVSGIVLAVYVTQHLINHAFGIVSFEAAEAYRVTVGSAFQNVAGQILLYGAFLFHGVIALKSVYQKSSLRLPLWHWLQLLFGLAVLPLLLGHVIVTRGMDTFGDVDPDYYYEIASLLLSPWRILQLFFLLLVVWLHLAIGLHYWLRLKSGYLKVKAYLYALAVLIPTLALVGVFNLFKEAQLWIHNEDALDEIFSGVRQMDSATLKWLLALEGQILVGMGVLLLLVLIARQIRIWLQLRRGTYVITHSSGKTVRGRAGFTLLESLRMARVPHASVCGGRGRCTTCRVRIASDLSSVDAPGELESLALTRIVASDDIRLACQMRPKGDIAITPLVFAQQTAADNVHAGGVQGHEEYVVTMFVDMRGSTAMGERVLAYDVVFILNRFFTELSLALEATHGHYAQFAGDGLMALYGIDPKRKQQACRDALSGAKAMFSRLNALNEQLDQEFGEALQIGVGIHGGNAIVGTMGPPTTPLLTAVGDNVNIAARLESQTKLCNCDVIISQETLLQADFDCSALATTSLEVRGRNENVAVYTLGQSELDVLLR